MEPAPGTAAVAPAPLASFASTRMVALPVQGLRGGDAMGWAAAAGDPRVFLAAVDSSLERTLKERGLGTVWAFPSDLARSARRNPLYATNPAAVRAGDAVRTMERRRGSEIPEPVASQLRAMAGIHDARHVLVPVEVRFEPGRAAGTARAVLHVAVLDVRLSQLAWSGDIAGAEAPRYSAAVATDLAQRFADLLVSR